MVVSCTKDKRGSMRYWNEVDGKKKVISKEAAKAMVSPGAFEMLAYYCKTKPSGVASPKPKLTTEERKRIAKIAAAKRPSRKGVVLGKCVKKTALKEDGTCEPPRRLRPKKNEPGVSCCYLPPKPLTPEQKERVKTMVGLRKAIKELENVGVEKPKRQATQKQLDNLARGRAIRAAKIAAKKGEKAPVKKAPAKKAPAKKAPVKKAKKAPAKKAPEDEFVWSTPKFELFDDDEF